MIDASKTEVVPKVDKIPEIQDDVIDEEFDDLPVIDDDNEESEDEIVAIEPEIEIKKKKKKVVVEDESENDEEEVKVKKKKKKKAVVEDGSDEETKKNAVPTNGDSNFGLMVALGGFVSVIALVAKNMLTNGQ